LPRQEAAWTLALEQDLLHLHHGPGQGFSLELALAAAALQGLLADSAPPELITLLGNEAQCAQLEAMLATVWAARADLSPAPVQKRYAALWDVLTDPASARLDLRQGEFACPLPWQRWWQQVRPVAVLAGVALLLQVSVQLLQLYQFNAHFREVQADITAAYRQVMPDGVLVDAEQQLRSQLGGQAAGPGGSVLHVLGRVAPLVAAHDGMTIGRLGWQGARRELQMAISARSNSDILALAAALQAAGLDAQPQQIVRQGSLQAANLVVREQTP